MKISRSWAEAESTVESDESFENIAVPATANSPSENLVDRLESRIRDVAILAIAMFWALALLFAGYTAMFFLCLYRPN